MDQRNCAGPSSGEKTPPRTTRVSAPSSDSEPAGFFLIHDEPPELVEATSRYQIVAELGRGGMGVVYRAHDLSLSRDVAIKVMFREHLDRPKLTRQFIEEARIMGSLQHPGIAHVYECGQTDDGLPFHSMKLVEGKTLFSMLHDDADDSQRTAQLLNIFSLVCQAMAYAHSQDVIHLDLKPANIMVGEFGEVHVMDWGLADSLTHPVHHEPSNRKSSLESSGVNQELATSHHVRGTLEYMAPEQARAERVDKRTDVFCLGGILCEILTGKPPYRGNDRVDVLKQAMNARLDPAIESLDECNTEIALVRLTKRCLSADPNDRPDHAGAVAAEMAAYSESALERVESDMTRFFELSLDLFCIAGFDGFFRRINNNFSRVLGFAEDELLTRPFLDFVFEDDRAKTIEVMGDLLEGQPVVRFCNRYRAADGSLILFEWTAKSIPSENLIFAVARNVTE